MNQQKQPVLSIRGLRKSFGSNEVLRLSPASFTSGTKAWPANVFELTSVIDPSRGCTSTLLSSCGL